jgi:integrase
LASLFADARHWGLWHGDNPAARFEDIPEHPRTRLLGRDGELAAFRQALEAEQDPDLRLWLMLRLFNGVRERNIFEMAWADVDLQLGKWRIGETKAGAPLLVQLAAPTVAELRARAKTDGTNPWVFPGHRRGTHLTTVSRKWKRFRAALGLNDLQPRDLRRTFGSWALWAGVPREAIASAMGHAPGSRITASVYAFADEVMNRATVDVTTRKMQKARAKPTTRKMLGEVK